MTRGMGPAFDWPCVALIVGSRYKPVHPLDQTTFLSGPFGTGLKVWTTPRSLEFLFEFFLFVSSFFSFASCPQDHPTESYKWKVLPSVFGSTR